MRIKKDDTVKVITGKDKGKTGRVLKVFPKTNKIVVEGVNVQTKHQKQTRTAPAQILHKEGTIDVSNVMYFDGKDVVKIGYDFDGDKKIRVNRKTGKAID